MQLKIVHLALKTKWLDTPIYHLVYFQPYLLRGAVVINYTRSELASINVAFNTAMCKIYKVKFSLLHDIYKYTGQSGVADVIIKFNRHINSCVQYTA